MGVGVDFSTSGRKIAYDCSERVLDGRVFYWGCFYKYTWGSGRQEWRPYDKQAGLEVRLFGCRSSGREESRPYEAEAGLEVRLFGRRAADAKNGAYK